MYGTDEETNAYLEGRQAAVDGQTRDNNPYDGDSLPQRYAWWDGHDEMTDD